MAPSSSVAYAKAGIKVFGADLIYPLIQLRGLLCQLKPSNPWRSARSGWTGGAAV